MTKPLSNAISFVRDVVPRTFPENLFEELNRKWKAKVVKIEIRKHMKDFVYEFPDQSEASISCHYDNTGAFSNLSYRVL